MYDGVVDAKRAGEQTLEEQELDVFLYTTFPPRQPGQLHRVDLCWRRFLLRGAGRKPTKARIQRLLAHFAVGITYDDIRGRNRFATIANVSIRMFRLIINDRVVR